MQISSLRAFDSEEICLNWEKKKNYFKKSLTNLVLFPAHLQWQCSSDSHKNSFFLMIQSHEEGDLIDL